MEKNESRVGGDVKLSLAVSYTKKPLTQKNFLAWPLQMLTFQYQRKYSERIALGFATNWYIHFKDSKYLTTKWLNISEDRDQKDKHLCFL